VDGLVELLRKRAGTVVLLFDRRTSSPADRLTGVAWSEGTSASPLVLESGAIQNGALRVTQAMWPTRLPTGAEVLARTPTANDSSTRPIVWSTVVGGGRLIVNGALNAWQFCSPEFDRYWQFLVGQIATAAQPALDVRVAQPLLRPGEATDIRVILRDAALAEPATAGAVHADVTALLKRREGDLALRLWPEAPGRLRGSLRGPNRAGTYQLVVSAGADRSETPVVVAPAPDAPHPTRTIYAAPTSPPTRGGFSPKPAWPICPICSRARAPSGAATSAIRCARSGGCFLALALSAECWIRRRSGLRKSAGGKVLGRIANFTEKVKFGQQQVTFKVQ
jgi:hypothetical protein